MTTVIGSGTYGTIYASKFLGRRSALKVLKQTDDFDSFMTPMIREVILGSCSDIRQGVLRVSDQCVIATDLGDATLSVLAPPKCLPIHLIRILGKQILEEIQQMHRLNIMHRDIKPDNIIFSMTKDVPVIRMIDFGLATAMVESCDAHVVTLWWRAPEIMIGLPYSKAIDIWSFGIIIASWCCGYQLMAKDTEEETLRNILEICGTPEWPEMQAIYPSIPNAGIGIKIKNRYEPVLEVIANSLTVNPNYRKSAEELLRDPFWSETPTDSEKTAVVDYLKTIKIQDHLVDTNEFEGKIIHGGNESNFIEYMQMPIHVHKDHVVMMKKLGGGDTILMVEALVIADRTLSKKNVPPRALIGASFYISLALLSDFVLPLRKISRLLRTSEHALTNALFAIFESIQCQRLPRHVKDELLDKPEWLSILNLL